MVERPATLLGWSSALAIGCWAAAGALAQPTPIDPTEFQVNVYTTGRQFSPRVAVSPEGAFMVVWTGDRSAGTDQSSTSIQGRRFRADGTAVDPEELQLNVYTTSYQRDSGVAILPSGAFVTVWDSVGSWGNDDEGQSVQMRRFGPDGEPLDPQEIQVNVLPIGSQRRAQVAAIGDDRFVVVWDSHFSFGTDQDGLSVQARRYRADGTPLDEHELQVNTQTLINQFWPSVASAPDGGFVVAWTGNDGWYYGIRARRYAADGTPLDAADFQVNTYTSWDQRRPRVAVDADGDFVVVWDSYGSAGSDQDDLSVQARRFARDGTPLDAAEFQVNTITYGAQWWPEVASDPEGSFVVAWTTLVPGAPPPGDWSAVARRFRKDGTAVDPVEFPLETSPDGEQTVPALALTPDGRLFATWTSELSSGGDPDLSIQLRRFGHPVMTVSAAVESAAVGPCTLGDAIVAANTGLPVGGCPAGNDGGVLELPAEAAFDLSFSDSGSNGLPIVERSVTIRGHGSTIRRDPSLGCPGGQEFRLFEVAEGGTLTLDDVTVANGCVPAESGGGILASGGTVILRRASIEGNEAGIDGGGVAITDGSLLGSDSVLRDNVAGGSGGGISVAGDPGWLVLERTTFSGNAATTGGGLAFGATVPGLVRNATLSGNQASEGGGGLALDAAGGGLRLEFSTVTANDSPGGAGARVEGGILSLHGSLLGDQASGADCAAGAGSVEATGLNLDTDGSCRTLAGGGVATVLSGLDLGLLADNGGWGPTLLPYDYSAAVDAAPACTTRYGATLRRDGRGFPRPTDDNGDGVAECELGAVERGPVFLDGFESGDPLRWSSATPPLALR